MTIEQRPNACRVEFYGPARLYADARVIEVELSEPSTLASLVRLLAERRPELVGPVIRPDARWLHAGYIFNRNGRDFLPDPAAIVQAGDRLLLLASAAGG